MHVNYGTVYFILHAYKPLQKRSLTDVCWILFLSGMRVEEKNRILRLCTSAALQFAVRQILHPNHSHILNRQCCQTRRSWRHQCLLFRQNLICIGQAGACPPYRLRNVTVSAIQESLAVWPAFFMIGCHDVCACINTYIHACMHALDAYTGDVSKLWVKNTSMSASRAACVAWNGGNAHATCLQHTCIMAHTWWFSAKRSSAACIAETLHRSGENFALTRSSLLPLLKSNRNLLASMFMVPCIFSFSSRTVILAWNKNLLLDPSMRVMIIWSPPSSLHAWGRATDNLPRQDRK